MKQIYKDGEELFKQSKLSKGNVKRVKTDMKFRAKYMGQNKKFKKAH